jgi:hypothetical protein
MPSSGTCSAFFRSIPTPSGAFAARSHPLPLDLEDGQENCDAHREDRGQPATTILPRSMDYIKGLYAVGQSVYNAAVDHIFYGETSS